MTFDWKWKRKVKTKFQSIISYLFKKWKGSVIRQCFAVKWKTNSASVWVTFVFFLRTSWDRFHSKLFSPTICKLIIILCCNSIPSHLITTKFCTCHDSSTVMVCTKFGGNQNFNIIKTWIPNILYILGISWLAGKNCTWNGFPAPAYQRLLRKVSKGSQISHVIAIIR